MKNKLKLIPFLLAVPLLFMANSPYPYAIDEPYEDFTAEVVYYAHDDERNHNILTLDITNTGTGYIALDSFNVSVDGKDLILNDFFFNGMTEKGREKLVLSPNQSQVVEYYVNRIYTDIDFEDAAITCNAFSNYTKLEISETELVNTSIINNEYKRYDFRIFGLTGFESGYNYSGIVEYTVKGMKIATFSDDWDGGDASFSLYSYDEAIAADDFEFTALYAVQGRKYYSGRFGDAIIAVLLLFVGAATILLPALAIVVFVILPAILIPIIVTKSVKKRRNQSPPNNDDSGPTT